MLGIQIGNEFLDLPPDTLLELESDNPFLQFNEELKGSFSLPFQVQATEKNLRLLNYAGILQRRITNTGIDALVYQKGMQHSRGKIKIERPTINMNRVAAGNISCYYLTGSSDFFQDSKGKRLRDIDMGGDRTFATHSIFWDHINAVLQGSPGDYDYAFYPVANTAWTLPGGTISIMNRIFLGTGSVPYFSLSADGNPAFGPANVIVPFPYLKEVLLKAVEYTGWQIEGDILSDSDFEKITMINFRAIDWVPYPHIQLIGTKSPVVFNLADHLPDISVPEFLLSLKNRFAWWYEFDFVSKKIVIKKMGSLVSLSTKDMTQYASPIIPKKIRQDDRIYALRNTFISGGGEGININAVNYQGELDNVDDLPAPAEALADQVYLVITENNFYWCVNDGGWVWQILSSNNADYDPAGSNEDIFTTATTADMVKYNDYMDLIPRIDSDGVWDASDEETEWYAHLCFYYGLRNNKSAQLVPFASHHVYDSNGNQLADWSLAFKGKLMDGTEVGLYDLNWKPFLDLLTSREEFEITLYLPMHEYLKLRFSDTIVVSGVKMFISKVNAVIPYKNEIKVEAIRIL